MKFIRITLVVCAILSFGLFAGSEVMLLRNMDRNPPQLTADTEVLEVTTSYTPQDLLSGVHAWDQEDGDLTDQVVLGPLSRFLEPGECNLTYVVFDSANQSATLTRRVRFTDYHSPRFILSAPLTFQEGDGTYTELLDRLTAWDMLDGDRTDWVVRVDTDLNFQKAGSYFVTFQVDNSYGDTAQLRLPVHVVPAQAGDGGITLTTGLVYLDVGDSLEPAKYLLDAVGADGTDISLTQVEYDTDANTSIPGVYEVHYTLTDSRYNTYETWLTVVVGGGA